MLLFIVNIFLLLFPVFWFIACLFCYLRIIIIAAWNPCLVIPAYESSWVGLHLLSVLLCVGGHIFCFLICSVILGCILYIVTDTLLIFQTPDASPKGTDVSAGNLAGSNFRLHLPAQWVAAESCWVLSALAGLLWVGHVPLSLWGPSRDFDRVYPEFQSFPSLALIFRNILSYFPVSVWCPFPIICVYLVTLQCSDVVGFHICLEFAVIFSGGLFCQQLVGDYLKQGLSLWCILDVKPTWSMNWM